MHNSSFTANQYGDVLLEDKPFEPFPLHRLKRVDRPTTLVTGDVKRVDSRDAAFRKAARGDYGPAVQREQNREKKEPLVAAQSDIIDHLVSIKDNKVAISKAPIPEEPDILSRHIKQLGYYLKADIMGICQLPQSAVYSFDYQGNPVNIDYPFAIVIVVGKDYETVNASTGYDWIVDSISFQAYHQTAIIAHTIANYVRRLGYRASPQHNRRYQVLLPPLLLQAGIGEVSRAGIILNPFLGLSYKAAAVLTDLPLTPDKPVDFGLQDFCQHCNICAEMCPGKAISGGDKVVYNGYETWKLNEQRCISFFLLNKKGAGCGRCVKVCPFTVPYKQSHAMKHWDFEDSGLVRKPAFQTKHLANRGRQNKKEKWWFDLVDIDGTLKIP